MLTKTSLEHGDQFLGLIEFRNTSRQDIDKSPAQIMFGRCTRSVIPVITKPCDRVNFQQREKRRSATKRCYDKRTRNL